MVSDSQMDLFIEKGHALEEETVSFLQEMVRTNSVNPPGRYENIHELLTSTYESFGWDVETVWVPDDLLEEYGIDPDYPRPNILGYANKGSGPTIALNAHIDTVPVNESEWTVDPFGGEISDGRVWGRGAKDSKGRIASYTLAGRILQELDALPDATIVMAMTADEEIGGDTGARYVTDSGALRPDYAIVEGAGWNQIWHAASGVIRYKLTVKGKSAHAGTRPEQGINAILGAAHLLLHLEEYATELKQVSSEISNVDYPTCVPAIIEGGVKTNVVPGSCSINVDTRVPPDHDVDEYESQFRKVVEEAITSMPDGISVHVETMRKSEPYNYDKSEPQIKAVKENADKALGFDVPVTGTRGSTDARHWAKNGARCVNYGSGDEYSNSHAADERVVIDQVRDVGIALAGALVDIAHYDQQS